MWDACRDLFWGTACVGCGAAGRSLCRACTVALPVSGVVCWPSPPPPGLALPMAAGEYQGVLRAMVLAHKEGGVLSLAAPLGDVLAGVVADLVAARPGPGRVLLVPVPSRARVVRRRGHDPMLRVARRAASRLRRTGVDTGVARLVAPVGAVRDQAGLDVADRARNLAGSMRARRLPRAPAGPVVVVDDVVTTGATARETQRALEHAGVPVTGVAAVAATRKRVPVRPGGSGDTGSLPVSERGG